MAHFAPVMTYFSQWWWAIWYCSACSNGDGTCRLAVTRPSNVGVLLNTCIAWGISDSDALADSRDNCPAVSNAGSDTDKVSQEAWNVIPDDDGDGASGHRRTAVRWVANAAPSRLDKDGKGDACDNDDDNDGVPDATDCMTAECQKAKKKLPWCATKYKPFALTKIKYHQSRWSTGTLLNYSLLQTVRLLQRKSV